MARRAVKKAIKYEHKPVIPNYPLLDSCGTINEGRQMVYDNGTLRTYKDGLLPIPASLQAMILMHRKALIAMEEMQNQAETDSEFNDLQAKIDKGQRSLNKLYEREKAIIDHNVENYSYYEKPNYDPKDHEGHKRRMRQRCLMDATDMQQHETLESILNFCITRKNTSELSHRLLQEFGSLSSVVDAHIDKLIDIDGMGEISAAIIKLLPVFYKLYCRSKCSVAYKVNSLAEAEDYFMHLLAELPNEQCFALCLSAESDIIACVKIAEGDIRRIDVSPETTANVIASFPTKYVYFGHNHLLGTSYPSEPDEDFTEELARYLKKLKIELKDHFILSYEGLFSFCLSDTHRRFLLM